MPIRNVLASVAVRDVNSAARWYETIIGIPPSRPMPELAEWSFQGGGGLQLYELKERAGSGSLTFVIQDFEGQVARLRKLSIDVSQTSSNERVKTVMITDPDGNHIAFAEALDPALLR